jgi:hypothetical protein
LICVSRRLAPGEAKEAQQATLKMAVSKLHEFNAGSKYFFNPRIHKIWSGKLPAAEGRKLDYYFRYPYIKKDTTVLQFPEGYVPEVLPKEKKLDTDYASYVAKTWFDEKEKAFYTTTTLVLKKHKIAAADYGKVKTFFDEVAADEAQKLVVKKTDAAPAAGACRSSGCGRTHRAGRARHVPRLNARPASRRRDSPSSPPSNLTERSGRGSLARAGRLAGTSVR